MRQLREFSDERLRGVCTYCGSLPDTRDHVPSRVFLDEPYPCNLPVVPACRECNDSFSLDEEYLACLIGCVLAGSASPPEISRLKIRRLLSGRPALVSRLNKARDDSNGVTIFRVEEDRVRNVLLKLARGHVLYELSEPHLENPSQLSFVPFPVLDRDSRGAFEYVTAPPVWPEVGSRAMQRWAEDSGPQWIVVQPGRYRYVVLPYIEVRIVLQEYLACQVKWEEF